MIGSFFGSPEQALMIPMIISAKQPRERTPEISVARKPSFINPKTRPKIKETTLAAMLRMKSTNPWLAWNLAY